LNLHQHVKKKLPKMTETIFGKNVFVRLSCVPDYMVRMGLRYNFTGLLAHFLHSLAITIYEV